MATNYDKLLGKIRELGMDYKWAGMFVKKLRDDETAFPVVDGVESESIFEHKVSGSLKEEIFIRCIRKLRNNGLQFILQGRNFLEGVLDLKFPCVIGACFLLSKLCSYTFYHKYFGGDCCGVI